jgi:hypothetical protein
MCKGDGNGEDNEGAGLMRDRCVQRNGPDHDQRTQDKLQQRQIRKICDNSLQQTPCSIHARRGIIHRLTLAKEKKHELPRGSDGRTCPSRAPHHPEPP